MSILLLLSAEWTILGYFHAKVLTKHAEIAGLLCRSGAPLERNQRIGKDQRIVAYINNLVGRTKYSGFFNNQIYLVKIKPIDGLVSMDW